MKQLIYLFFICNIMVVFSQNHVMKSDTIPNLVSHQNYPQIKITDPYINDTLKVFYQVIVSFEHPLKDTMAVIKPVNIHLYSFRVINFKSKSILINSPSLESQKTNEQKYIWWLCDSLLRYWMLDQNYNLMTNRYLFDNRVMFYGGFYIMPEMEEIKDSKHDR